jgi:hypothetical protein
MLPRACRSTVARFLSALLLGLGAVAAADADTFRHPTGLQLSLPEGWQAVRLEGTDLLQPPDGTTDEAYIVSVASATGIARADDPRALQTIESQMQALLPTFARVGETQPIAAGSESGVLLTWSGTATDGSAWEARAHVVISGEFSLVLLAIAPREALAARARTLQEIFATFERTEGERDPGIAGLWSYTVNEPRRSGEFTLVFYRNVRAQLHPDGRFETSETSGYAGGDLSTGLESEESRQLRGHWYAGRGVFYLLLEDGTNIEVDYAIDGEPGSRRIFFRPLLRGMSHLEELR